MWITKFAVTAALAGLLVACGGGGSSSGGMEPVLGPELPLGKFSGNYRIGPYAGSIAVTINGSSDVIIELTGMVEKGVNCLPRPFKVMGTFDAARITNGQLSVGGAIEGVPLSNIGTIPSFGFVVPIEGGAGTIDAFNPPAPCLSQVDGTITLVR